MTQREFSQFVAQYEKLVFTICYQFVKDYHEAQNLSQETFLSAYRHIDSYQGDNYKPWIARIATNKAKDYLNSAYHRRVMLADDEENTVETMASVKQTDPAQQPDELYIKGTLPLSLHPALYKGKRHTENRLAVGAPQKDGRNTAVPRKVHLTKADQGGIPQ